MNTPDKDVLVNVILWESYAEEDWNLATYAMTMPGTRPYRLIAYHAQQCAEKYLKAYLVYHNIDFPFTHNIRVLLNLCGKDSNWAEKLKDAEQLTPYAITARYPGVDEPVTEIEAKNAVDIASKVRDVIRKDLSGEGIIFGEDISK